MWMIATDFPAYGRFFVTCGVVAAAAVAAIVHLENHLGASSVRSAMFVVMPSQKIRPSSVGAAHCQVHG